MTDISDRLRENLAKLRERTKDLPPVDVKEWQGQQEAKYRKRKLEEGERRKAEFMARMASLDHKFAYGPVVDGRRRYRVNETDFDVIDTEEKAYWLGFIFADGSIHYEERYLEIRLSSIDINHLRKFCQFISPGQSPSYDSKGDPYIHINSQYLVWSLSKWGVVPGKTYTNLDLPMIPIELMPHFLRGLVDGDGSVYIIDVDWFICIVSYSRNILDQINDYLMMELGIAPMQVLTSNGSWKIRKGGNIQVPQIVHYLYNGATIYLDRKMEIARRVMQEFPISH